MNGMKYRQFRMRLLSDLIVLCVILSGYQALSQPLATGHTKFLGCAVGSTINSNFDSYWNQVTPGNGGKWGSVERIGIDVYEWGEADQAYSYALARGFPFKFHKLVWGQQQPGWITARDSASQYQEVEEWIRLVGERYPLMSYIDVVNEPLPSHAPPPYAQALGGNGSTRYDWVIKAFQLARQYCDPRVKLILNDYNIINEDGNTTELLYRYECSKKNVTGSIISMG
jgi:endo-1,4-beta-xylanase